MASRVISALAQMERHIKRERTADSVSKRRQVDADLGRHPRRISDGQIRNAARLMKGRGRGGVLCDLGSPRSTFYRRARALED
ncbi:hypothetical protein [Frondihabitans peucedani]|uniref:hypothetical protein n=1 Tax=Frondihabitans peucedani TaxID=598626 RepID=UPI0031DF8C81